MTTLRVVETACWPNKYRIAPGGNGPENFFSTREAAERELIRRERLLVEDLKALEASLRKRGVIL